MSTMFNFATLFGRREIDAWRDQHSLIAAAVLNESATDLIRSLDAEVAGASWKDGLVGQSQFIATRIAPIVRAEIEPVVARIVEHANIALREIVEHQAIWHDRPDGPQQQSAAFEGWQDLASAAGPLAGGAAVALALPAMAVTTTTAWFGLVTMTTVSWPVVAIGGTLVGVAVATGATNTAKIWDRTEARLRRRVRDYVVGTLIEGTPDHPSLLACVIETLNDAAVRAKALR